MNQSSHPTPHWREAMQGLLNAMDMQEKRETEEFHIKQDVALGIWNDAKDAALATLAAPPTESPDEWYARERAAFIAWWESDGQKKFSETPTLAAGAGWFARAEAAPSEKKERKIPDACILGCPPNTVCDFCQHPLADGDLSTQRSICDRAAPSATLPQRLREQGYADVPHPVLGSAPCDKSQPSSCPQCGSMLGHWFTCPTQPLNADDEPLRLMMIDYRNAHAMHAEDCFQKVVAYVKQEQARSSAIEPNILKDAERYRAMRRFEVSRQNAAYGEASTDEAAFDAETDLLLSSEELQRKLLASARSDGGTVVQSPDIGER